MDHLGHLHFLFFSPPAFSVGLLSQHVKERSVSFFNFPSAKLRRIKKRKALYRGYNRPYIGVKCVDYQRVTISPWKSRLFPYIWSAWHPFPAYPISPEPNCWRSKDFQTSSTLIWFPISLQRLRLCTSPAYGLYQASDDSWHLRIPTYAALPSISWPLPMPALPEECIRRRTTFVYSASLSAAAASSLYPELHSLRMMIIISSL